MRSNFCSADSKSGLSLFCVAGVGIFLTCRHNQLVLFMDRNAKGYNLFMGRTMFASKVKSWFNSKPHNALFAANGQVNSPPPPDCSSLKDSLIHVLLCPCESCLVKLLNNSVPLLQVPCLAKYSPIVITKQHEWLIQCIGKCDKQGHKLPLYQHLFLANCLRGMKNIPKWPQKDNLCYIL